MHRRLIVVLGVLAGSTALALLWRPVSDRPPVETPDASAPEPVGAAVLQGAPSPRAIAVEREPLQIQPPPSAVGRILTVRVAWPDERVVAERTARVIACFETERFEAQTDASGRAMLRGVPQGVGFLLAVAKPFVGIGYVEIRGDADAGERIDLEPGVVLAGQVVDEQTNEPIAAAEVGVLYPSLAGTRPGIGRATTDAAGRYETVWLRRTADTDYASDVVVATARGYAIGLQNLPDAPVDAAHIQTDFHLRTGGVVQGSVVRPDGSPAARADVRLLPQTGVWTRRDPWTGVDRDWAPAPLFRTRTDAQGAFEVVGLELGEAYAAVARTRGFSTSTPIGDLRPTSASRVVDVELSLQPPAALIVEVQDEAGIAIPGARVDLDHDERHRKQTDADGRARFAGLTNRSYEVLVTAPASRPRYCIVETPPGVATRCTLRLELGHAIAGVLLDATGQPLAHRTVHAESDGRGSDAKTDAAGRFRIGGLEPGPHTVWVAEASTHVFEASAPARDVQVRIPAHGEVRLRVASVGREPLSVRHSIGRGTTTIQPKIREIGGQTYYEFGAPPGRNRFLFVPRDHAPFERTIDIPEGGTALITQDLRRGKTLRGRVVDSRGRPIAEGLASAYELGSRSSPLDDEGRFTLHNLGTQPVKIGVRAKRFESRTVTYDPADGDGTLEVTLTRESVLHGRVLDADGRPAPRAIVYAQPVAEDDVTYYEETDAVGAFRLTLPSGRVQVGVIVGEDEEVPRTTVVVPPGGRAPVDLTLPR